MMNLKEQLDNNELSVLKQSIKDGLQSAEGYDNKLKLTLALTTIIREAADMLKAIDKEAFISEVRELADKLIAEGQSAEELFTQHLSLNGMVAGTPIKAQELQDEIDGKLKEYDALLKEVIESRQNEPLEKRSPFPPTLHFETSQKYPEEGRGSE